jgi:hypothetical protein
MLIYVLVSGWKLFIPFVLTRSSQDKQGPKCPVSQAFSPKPPSLQWHSPGQQITARL